MNITRFRSSESPSELPLPLLYCPCFVVIGGFGDGVDKRFPFDCNIESVATAWSGFS